MGTHIIYNLHVHTNFRTDHPHFHLLRLYKCSPDLATILPFYLKTSFHSYKLQLFMCIVYSPQRISNWQTQENLSGGMNRKGQSSFLFFCAKLRSSWGSVGQKFKHANPFYFMGQHFCLNWKSS